MRALHVLSAVAVAHAFLKRELETPTDPDHDASLLPPACRAVRDAFFDFFIDVLFAPKNVGVSEETSLNLDGPGFTFDIHSFYKHAYSMME